MTDTPQPPDEPGQPFRPGSQPPNQPYPNQPPPSEPPPNQPYPNRPGPGAPFQPPTAPSNQPPSSQPPPQPLSNTPTSKPAPGLPFQPPTEPPNQPFQPGSPYRQAGPGLPPSSGESTALQAFLGVFGGLAAGVGLPLLLIDIVLPLTGVVSGTIGVVLAIFAAFAIPIAGFVIIIKALDKNAPKQAAARTALVISGWISIGFWALVLLLVGLCTALLGG